jgi:hypothetical protein
MRRNVRGRTKGLFASRNQGAEWSHWSEWRADAIARCRVDRYTEDGDIGAVEPIPIGACWLASERCQTDEGHVHPVRCCGWCYRLSLQCPSTDRGDSSPAAEWVDCSADLVGELCEMESQLE